MLASVPGVGHADFIGFSAMGEQHDDAHAPDRLGVTDFLWMVISRW